MKHNKSKREIHLLADIEADSRSRMPVGTLTGHKTVKIRLLNLTDKPTPKQSPLLQKTLYYYTRHPSEAHKLKLPSILEARHNSTDESTPPQIVLPEPSPSRSANATPSRRAVSFQSPINKIRFELVRGLGGLPPPVSDSPDPARVARVLETLERVADERQVFGDALGAAVAELRRGLYLRPGDFFKVFPLPAEYREGTEHEICE